MTTLAGAVLSDTLPLRLMESAKLLRQVQSRDLADALELMAAAAMLEDAAGAVIRRRVRAAIGAPFS